MAEVLCKIIRESHLTADELAATKEVIVRQMVRGYDNRSPFLPMLIYTMNALKARK